MNKYVSIYPLLVIVTIVVMGCHQNTESPDVEKEADVVETNTALAQKLPIDKNVLLGSWVRTDAPYQLKIASFAGDGTMKAEYFNPKSIHIGKGSWIEENGLVNIYVELRDENYPGSHYTLIYVADKDLLAGKYFQAVEGVTYDVGFMRAK